ncbi:hypothetical protein L6272_01990 [Microgenomates group bacterium]|nr:hypothetical protein [Microgenomates group bacterium]
MTKLQIALTDQEASNLNLLAMGLGYNLTKYVKFLIAQKAAAVSESIPTFRMSEKMEKRVEEVWANHLAGKTIKVNSLAEYLKKTIDEN